MATVSELRSKPAEWLAQYIGLTEGDTQHKEILSIFNSSYSGYTMTTSDAWCAAAASAAFVATDLTDIFPCVECSCNRMVTLAQSAGIWAEDDSYTPNVGDVILYDWQDTTGSTADNTGTPDHVGIVSSVSGSTITVIEGNYSDTVGYHTVTVNGSYIRGYITPNYAAKATENGTESTETASATTDTSTEKTATDVAYEVLQGLWGNGDERKTALTNAGYDYDEVQAIVNKLVSGESADDTTSTGDDTVATKLNVIDVSECQGTIDWDTVQNHIDGAILRCGLGSDIKSQDDAQFSRNLSECERLGIPHGVYFVTYATNATMVQSELSHILRLINGHSYELPIYIDVEVLGTESYAATACNALCKGLEEAGYTAGVYASTSWWDDYLASVTSYRRWVAQWASKCTYTGDYDIWQYSETGTVDGISGTVGLDYCYTPFAEMVSGTGSTATTDTTETKTADEIAAEVIAGLWGNGDERKAALTAAGYDFSEVQTAVNALMSGTTTKSVSEVAKEVVQGLWGNGDARKTALEAAGYDFSEVQAAVNELMG